MLLITDPSHANNYSLQNPTLGRTPTLHCCTLHYIYLNNCAGKHFKEFVTYTTGFCTNTLLAGPGNSGKHVYLKRMEVKKNIRSTKISLLELLGGLGLIWICPLMFSGLFARAVELCPSRWRSPWSLELSPHRLWLAEPEYWRTLQDYVSLIFMNGNGHKLDTDQVKKFKRNLIFIGVVYHEGNGSCWHFTILLNRAS